MVTPYEYLRDLRNKLANRNHVEPYMILPDRTLRALASIRPKSLAEVEGIPGIGPVKLNAVVPRFLGAIAKWEKTGGFQARVIMTIKEVPKLACRLTRTETKSASGTTRGLIFHCECGILAENQNLFRESHHAHPHPRNCYVLCGRIRLRADGS